MKKKIIIILLILVALSSFIFVNLGIKTTAQECNDCTPIPTPPGNSDYSKINCECSGATPTIKASADTIASGGSITMYVNSGGLACPPYTWSTSSSKYSLDKSTTSNDLETVTMTADSGSCNSGYSDEDIYVTVTVTDNCGKTSQVIIRNTGGSWVYKYILNCSTTTCGSDPTVYIEVLFDTYKYRISYCVNSAGNLIYSCSSCDDPLTDGWKWYAYGGNTTCLKTVQADITANKADEFYEAYSGISDGCYSTSSSCSFPEDRATGYTNKAISTFVNKIRRYDYECP